MLKDILQNETIRANISKNLFDLSIRSNIFRENQIDTFKSIISQSINLVMINTGNRICFNVSREGIMYNVEFILNDCILETKLYRSGNKANAVSYLLNTDEIYSENINNSKNLTIFELADTFLSFGIMTHKKLQRLCYYAYVWYMIENGVDAKITDCEFEIINDEIIFKELYEKYKDYRGRLIVNIADTPRKVKEDVKLLEFLAKIYEIYAKHNDDKLRSLEQAEVKALKKVYKLSLNKPNSSTFNESVYEYYSNI